MKNNSTEKIGFIAGNLTGLLTALLIALFGFLFFGYRVGFYELIQNVWEVVTPSSRTQEVLDISDDILAELTAAEAVIRNAGNPTNARPHDTIIAKPDERLGYVLRPNARILVHVLRSRKPINIDPPLLHMRLDTNPSDALISYLDAQSRLHYKYSVDKNGFRVTTPAVEAERKILVVGDSVAFGVGVNDDQTMASQLQSLLGQSYQVANAGVGGYTAEQSLEMAKKLSEEEQYDALIYVTSQNDFMTKTTINSLDAKGILKEFADLKHRFSSGRIIVMVVAFMEYSIHDILLDEGWPQPIIDRSEVFYSDLPLIAEELDIEYIDWMEIVKNYTHQTETIYSRFALYADHAHLSPLGNQIAAEKIHEALERKP